MFPALLLAVVVCSPTPTCTPEIATGCATPTPTLQWDSRTSYDTLEGYRLYVREDGGPMELIDELPCEWGDLDDDGIFETRNCRGADFSIPVQRHCPFCYDYSLYEFAVKARDLFGRESELFSNPIAICMPPIYDIFGGGPYE